MSTTVLIAMAALVIAIAIYRHRRRSRRRAGTLSNLDVSLAVSAMRCGIQVIGYATVPELDSPKDAMELGRVTVMDGGISYACVVSIIAGGYAANYVQNKNKPPAATANLFSLISNLIADEFGYSHEQMWDFRGVVLGKSADARFLLEESTRHAVELRWRVNKDEAFKNAIFAVANCRH